MNSAAKLQKITESNKCLGKKVTKKVTTSYTPLHNMQKMHNFAA